MILLGMFYVGGFLIIIYGIGLLLLLTSFDSKTNHLSDLDEIIEELVSTIWPMSISSPIVHIDAVVIF